LFGRQSADLTGDFFTAVFTTTTGGLSSLGGLTGFQQIIGGTNSGEGPGVTTALFTLSNSSQVLGSVLFTGAVSSSLLVGIPEGIFGDYIRANSVTANNGTYLDMVVGNPAGTFVSAADITTTVNHTVTAPDNSGGTFSVNNAVLILDVATVTSGAIGGGVPEPASWALMLTGFGAMGAMLRRRRASFQTA
jgi:hypothetical protein